MTVFLSVDCVQHSFAMPAARGESVGRPRAGGAAMRLMAVVAMTALVASPLATTPLAAQSAPYTGRATAMPTAPSAPPLAPAAPDFVGVWLDDTGDGAVEIKPCAPPTPDQFCGSIFWLKSPNDKAGRPLRDGNNEDAKERRRPICGLPTLGGLKRQQSGALDDGWIYDPRRGQRFDLELTLKGPDKLQVVGYKGFKFLSKTFIWTRAPATLPRCQPPV